MSASQSNELELNGGIPHFLTKFDGSPIYVVIPPDGIGVVKKKEGWVMKEQPWFLVPPELMDGDGIRFDVQAHIDNEVKAMITTIIEELDASD